ncbi:hypothetical protein [Trueperella pyogenes]|uniref:hypothetical protein n=1 Tax=Trueperella pyogenes TaxID=1661 RepID=UPI00345D29B3
MGGWILDRIGEAFASVLSLIAGGIAGVAVWLTKAVMGLALGTTLNVDAQFLNDWYARLFGVAVPLIVVLAGIQVLVSSVGSGRVNGGVRALGGAAGATVITMFAFPLVLLMVQAADGVCAALWDLTGADMDTAASNVAGFYTTGLEGDEEVLREAGFAESAGNLLGAFLMLIFATLSIIASVLLWVVLTVRDQLLYISIVALPIAIAGITFNRTASWPRRLLGWIMALAWCKLGVVVALGMGSTAIAGATAENVSVASRASLMISFAAFSGVGAFMPAIAFKFFDFIGGELEMAATTREVTSAMSSVPERLSGHVSTPSSSTGSDSGGGGDSGPGGGPLDESVAAESGETADTASNADMASAASDAGAASGASSGAAAGSAGGPAGMVAGAVAGEVVDKAGEVVQETIDVAADSAAAASEPESASGTVKASPFELEDPDKGASWQS